MPGIGIEGSLCLLLSVLCYAASNAARKYVSGKVPHQSDQVFVASGVEAIGGLLALTYYGGVSEDWDASGFFYATVAAAVLNAITRLLELKAISTTQLSELAPYYGIEPATQYITAFLIDNKKQSTLFYGLPLGEIGICLVTVGTFYAKSPAGKTVGNIFSGMPSGAKYIILNCFLCCITTRLAKVAVALSGSLVLYFTCNHVVMACTAYFTISPGFWNRRPPTAVLLVAVLEAVYLILFYQSLQTLPPAIVTTAKRGGGMIVTSVLGMLIFKERVSIFPLLITAAGVTALCSA